MASEKEALEKRKEEISFIIPYNKSEGFGYVLIAEASSDEGADEKIVNVYHSPEN